MKITARASVDVPRPIEEVFDFATACDGFPRFLFPLGPLPGIRSSRMLDAPAPKTGARREVVMTDSSRLEEELLAYDRPSRHRYRWLNRPARPFSWLVRGGEGDWSFTPTADGTRVIWLYTFEPTSAVTGVLARPLVWFFQRWMQRGLDRLRATLAG